MWKMFIELLSILKWTEVMWNITLSCIFIYIFFILSMEREFISAKIYVIKDNYKYRKKFPDVVNVRDLTSREILYCQKYYFP